MPGGISGFYKRVIIKMNVSASESRVRTGELTYGRRGGLSNGERGNKRKDRDVFHDGDGEGKGRGSSGERATEFICIISLGTTLSRAAS